MSQISDKRDRSSLFKQRLLSAMAARDMNQSQLARAVEVDRSTISQLIKDDGACMPNAQLVAEAAQALGVSSDWLLGLSDFSEQTADVMAQAMSMQDAPRALIDEHIFGWHVEAAGYKIRHVPAGLPDMLKTQAMLEWEYEPTLGRTTQQAIGASQDRLDWMRNADSDYEIVFPLHDLQAFARAEGYYRDCPRTVRQDQLAWMAQLYEQLYPNLRLHLFDARRLFSAPVTVFGPKIAVIYMGQKYLVFRDKDRVKALTQHFDVLVREADIGSREIGRVLEELRAEIA